MTESLRIASISFLLLAIGGCANFSGDELISFSGDELISLTKATDYPPSEEIFTATRNALSDLYLRLKLPRERQLPVEAIAGYEIIQHGSDVSFTRLADAVLLISGMVEVSYCYRCIIIASGDIKISHGGNNVIVSDGSVDIGHDNSRSLIVAKRDVRIGFAKGTTIDAHGIVDISHRFNVFVYAR